jgi:hypothetical protein
LAERFPFRLDSLLRIRWEEGAYLKRALDHLHQAQAGLEAVAPRKLLPEKMVADARKELFEIREGILKLMDEFRGRK